MFINYSGFGFFLFNTDYTGYVLFRSLASIFSYPYQAIVPTHNIILIFLLYLTVDLIIILTRLVNGKSIELLKIIMSLRCGLLTTHVCVVGLVKMTEVNKTVCRRGKNSLKTRVFTCSFKIKRKHNRKRSNDKRVDCIVEIRFI